MTDITLDQQIKHVDSRMKDLINSYNQVRNEGGKNAVIREFPDIGQEYANLGAIKQSLINYQSQLNLFLLLLSSSVNINDYNNNY